MAIKKPKQGSLSMVDKALFDTVGRVDVKPITSEMETAYLSYAMSVIVSRALPEIHGLAHVSELAETPVEDTTTIAKIGETMKFRVVSIEPIEHRLGLSLKALKEKPKEEKTEEVKA